MSQKLTVPHPRKKIDKTTLIVLSVIGVVLLIGCVVLGAAFDYALGKDGSIDSSKLSPALHYVLSHPAVIISAITKKDGYVPKMLFVGVCVIGIFALYKYSEEPKRLHRRGTEHGSAKWGDEKEIRALAEKEKKPYQLALRDENGSRQYDDKGEFVCAEVDYNIVLAKDVYLALNTKQHRLNLNTLVIGGSGSGKTLFWVITNLLQLNTSFVITDPKGEIFQATAKLLQEAGYEVRVFNTIQMEHSNNYNPFHYIYDHNGDLCEDNVKKMADVLFQATKGDGEKDDFWSQKGQTVLLALMFLLIEQSEYNALFDENGKIIPGTRDESNLNFYAITEKMRGLQYPPQGSQKPDGLFLTQLPGESNEAFAARQEKGFLCPLDREFLELQHRKPDTLAFRLYKEIRNAPEETGQSFVSSANVKTFFFNLENLKNLTCCDNVHLETLGDKKTALFIIISATKRIVAYDIKELGKNMQTLSMMIVLENIWDRVAKNRARGIRTQIMVDEMYLLFKSEQSANFFYELYKRARKWGGIPCGITQNVDDLLRSERARTMISNTQFVVMLGQNETDREQLANLLHIPKESMDTYLNGVGAGNGMIYAGDFGVIPFDNSFPTDTDIYRIITTKFGETQKAVTAHAEDQPA